MSRTCHIIGDLAYSGIPTNNLTPDELEQIKEFRTAGYQDLVTGIQPSLIDEYIDGSMDAWEDANVAVGKSLRLNQVFGNTVVWIATTRGDNPQIVGEVLSADNASSKRSGVGGAMIRAAKMFLPAMPRRGADGTITLQGTPYKALRELLGPTDVVSRLTYFTAIHEARQKQPMTAYAWEEEGVSEALRSWSFDEVYSEFINPFGKEHAAIKTLSFRAESALVVSQRILGVVEPNLREGLLQATNIQGQ